MFDLRRKIYQELVNSVQISSLVDDRVFQANNQFTPPQLKPFLVYRMGLQDVTDAYVTGGRRSSFSVWVHDEPGDYHGIDTLLGHVKTALLASTVEPGFLEFRYIETGPDTEDTDMGTILRWSRWQAVMVDH
jgi:hypothetical protein